MIVPWGRLDSKPEPMPGQATRARRRADWQLLVGSDGDRDFMHIAHRTPAVALTARPTGDLETDLLVIPVFEDDDLADLTGLDAATGGELARARARQELRGKPFELFFTGVTGWKTPRALLIGAGSRNDCAGDRLRRIAM